MTKSRAPPSPTARSDAKSPRRPRRELRVLARHEGRIVVGVVFEIRVRPACSPALPASPAPAVARRRRAPAPPRRERRAPPPPPPPSSDSGEARRPPPARSSSRKRPLRRCRLRRRQPPRPRRRPTGVPRGLDLNPQRSSLAEAKYTSPARARRGTRRRCLRGGGRARDVHPSPSSRRRRATRLARTRPRASRAVPRRIRWRCTRARAWYTRPPPPSRRRARSE